MNYKKVKPFVLTVTILYTIMLIYLMFFGFGRITYSDYLYNLVPFKSIRESFEIYIFYVKNYPDIASNSFRNFAINIFGNIGMFIPFGILLPIIFDGKFLKSFIIFEIGIIIVELTQYQTRRGVCDIDDFILNTIGFLTGYALVLIINKINFGRVK